MSTMLKPALQLKLGQQLTMTPQLQQAIRLLQLPALELQAHIREAAREQRDARAAEEAEADRHLRRRSTSRAGTGDEPTTPATTEPSRRSRSSMDEPWSRARTPVPPTTPWSGDDDERQQEFADDAAAIAAASTCSGSSSSARLDAARARDRRGDRRCDQRRRLPDASRWRRSPQTLQPEVECRSPRRSRRVLARRADARPGRRRRAHRWASASSCSCAQLDPATPGLATSRSRSRATTSSWSPSASSRCCGASCGVATKSSRARSRWCAAAIRARARPSSAAHARVRRARRVRAPHRRTAGRVEINPATAAAACA